MRNIIKKLGTLIGVRRTLNFIEGSNVTLTIADNTSTNEVDITIAAASGSSLSGTTNTVAYFNTSSSIASLATTTYPSLTELSYVKGLTSAVQTQINSKGSGTVTNVSALTLATTGTDLSSSVANGTTTPVITLNVPTASSTNRGVLSSTDWTTFNNKQNALGYTPVNTTLTISTTAPLSGGGDLSANRTLTISQATTSTNGYLSSVDWNTFNNKQATLVSGTNIKTVTGISILGSGDVYPAHTSAATFITAETAISTAAYADITGASVSLAAGTWIIYGNIICRATNTAILAHAAITDSANVVIAEASQGCPASGSANVNQYININITAIVTPSTTTTYKLRAARGNTTITGTYTVVDGAGVGTTNNISDNSDKGTSIIALRIA